MKITKYTDIPSNPLGLPGAENVAVRLLVGEPDGAPNFVMMLLELGPGGHTPGHHHPWEETIFIKSGSGELETCGDVEKIETGTVLFFKPDEPHKFVNTGSEPLELLCVIPRRD